MKLLKFKVDPTVCLYGVADAAIELMFGQPVKTYVQLDGDGAPRPVRYGDRTLLPIACQWLPERPVVAFGLVDMVPAKLKMLLPTALWTSVASENYGISRVEKLMEDKKATKAWAGYWGISEPAAQIRLYREALFVGEVLEDQAALDILHAGASVLTREFAPKSRLSRDLGHVPTRTNWAVISSAKSAMLTAVSREDIYRLRARLDSPQGIRDYWLGEE